MDLSRIERASTPGVAYRTDKECLAGTRTATLDEICKWINCVDESTPNIRLLLGQAGTGKSTIAHTVAGRFRQLKRLGAAFCFSSSTPHQSERLLPTLAVNLASFDQSFKRALWEGVGQDFDAQTTSDLTRQFEDLILKPSEHLAAISSVFILIDGLDEIGTVTARAPLLRFLSNHLRDLAPGFRILLTARPESDILALFDTHGSWEAIFSLRPHRADEEGPAHT